jgi:hypothetical protein
VPTFLRRLSSPLMQVGDLVFDVELSGRRGGRREYTEERIAAGVSVSDHSFRVARRFTLSAGVSAIAQMQNLGRPGAASLVDSLTELGEGLAANLSIGDSGLGQRITDFETRLDALIDLGDELELVSKVVGRPLVVLEEWDSTNGPEDGNAAVYNMTFKEVQRAGLTIADAVPSALALNGSGGVVSPGSGGGSMATPGTLSVVP